MSPRKLTEDDKQEILQLYRNSEATTSTLANRYEVSSSTISRFLKNKLSSTEYEDLIQQKRLARTPRGEKALEKKETKPKEKTVKAVKAKKTPKKSLSKAKAKSTEVAETVAVASDVESTKIVEPIVIESESESKPESKPTPKRRRRRRSSASDKPEPKSTSVAIAAEDREEIEEKIAEPIVAETTEEEKPAKLIIDRKSKEDGMSSADSVIADESDKFLKSNNLILKNDKPKVVDSSSFEEDEDDDDENELDLITLKEMLGEDLEDINDEEDEEDDDDDWEEENETPIGYPKRDSNFTDLEILPLSQATFPRTCYLVIDRSAELIVKPLAEFADLGEIPQDEIRQRTLPVFDNHRIAKRFSHRRERVIKVPDGRMLQKTSRHLQEKGITRLLIDGQIYSLST